MSMLRQFISKIKTHANWKKLSGVIVFLGILIGYMADTSTIIAFFKGISSTTPQPTYYAKTLNPKGIQGFQQYISTYR
jgi:hypothetical protein